ncbi:hypothetical protein [Galbibacter pacificus]|uniref:Uncharacterized protein n=1 Tax=Galbibacter pacificus TaxID=2996052 RepID=A0ABT6FQD4_9FLAO|nr:hypothetical protein [Galbibacter pacificus]MDG3582045.1 hypothetical protein [Galbibacter pacificus]MDG3585481.1 hypothetical protein [Galbibacter pacificus]
MILTRSPYTIHPSKIVGTTSAVNMTLHCWTSGSMPGSPTYTIFKNVPPSTIEFEISNLIKDFYVYTPIYYSSTGVRKSIEGNIVAVNIYQTYLTPVDTENFTGLFATDGYGYFMEGENPDIPSNKILLSNDYYVVNASGYFNIPVLKSAGTININGTNYNYQTGTEIRSNLQNIWLDLSNFEDDFTVTIGGNEIYFEIKSECKYTPKDIMFLNKYGAWEIMTFFKKPTESLKTESKEFKPYTRTYQRYNTTGRENLELNSGFLPEWYNETVKQLLLSEHVYLLEGGTHIPLTVDTSSYEFKTRKTDKLISHNIKFKYAFDVI